MGKKKSKTVTTLGMQEWKPFLTDDILVDDCRILVTDGPHKGFSAPIAQVVTEVGRDEFSHIPLPKDLRVSKLHCEILIDDLSIRVRDNKSRNGVFLGGHRILDAFWELDVPLTIGKSTLLLERSSQQRKIEVKFFDESENLVGKSDAMRKIFSRLLRLQEHAFPVLLTGETGTGKTTVARVLHEQSHCANGPLVTVNCGAIPPDLMESEFFGYEPGAFTGADKNGRKGFCEQADGGTLFLDEIGELPITLQAKLLDVLESQKVRRLGGAKEHQVQFRVIAATHMDFEQAITKKQFREDLYYRLAVVELKVPSLRERIEDLPLLIELFLSQMSPKRRIEVSEGAMMMLQAYPWPGNIRELRNVLQRIVAFLDGTKILPEHIELRGVKSMPMEPSHPWPVTQEETQVSSKKRAILPLKEQLALAERKALLAALEETHWNVSKASRMLEVHRSWSYMLMKKYGLKAPK